MDLNFEVRHLHRFISHGEKFQNYASIFLTPDWIKFSTSISGDSGDMPPFKLSILYCKGLDLQISSLAQVFTPLSPLLSVERLIISGSFSRHPLRWQDDMGNIQWRGFLRPFTAVKSLRISYEVVFYVCDALKELTNVLPALRSVTFEEGLPQGDAWKSVGRFVAARQLSGHPVSVSICYLES